MLLPLLGSTVAPVQVLDNINKWWLNKQSHDTCT